MGTPCPPVHGIIGLNPESSLPPLLNALDSTNASIRREAAYIVPRFGAPAHLAIPALSRLCSDPDPIVRQTATNALRKIHGQPPAEESNP